jgi:hypothetical protein
MSVTLDIPDQLAELLRTLAAQRGVPIEVLGEQALAVGLTTLAHDGDTADISLGAAERPRQATAQLPSPTIVSGNVRPLQVTFEPAAKGKR